MAIEGRAWKTTTEKNADDCFYRIQVNGILGIRQETQVVKALDDWEQAGGGHNNKTGEDILFFVRDFGTVDKFMSWGKRFDAFPIVELDKNGDPKKYVKIGPGSGKSSLVKSSPTNAGAPKSLGRRCGKCDKIGHNARTCGREGPPKAVGAGVKGHRKCGKCGDVGHNARTCKASGPKAVNVARVAAKVNGGKYKCGHCGDMGHNKRTCPELGGK